MGTRLLLASSTSYPLPHPNIRDAWWVYCSYRCRRQGAATSNLPEPRGWLLTGAESRPKGKLVEEDAYTPGQAAKILKVSDGYVRRLVQRLASKL